MTLRVRLARIAVLASAAVALAAPSAARADSLLVNANDDRPATVSADRLYELADDAATRWHFSVDGNTGARVGARDGTQAAGFSDAIDPKVLGVTTVWTRPHYKLKKTRRCSSVRGRRVCKTTRRYVKTRDEVVEKDVQLNPFVKWQEGPAYPAADEYDLESTILHEFGHFSHPLIDNHVFGCENSPMIASISPGEFWRDSDDWLRYRCSQSTGPRARRTVPAGPALPMLVQEHRLPRSIDR